MSEPDPFLIRIDQIHQALIVLVNEVKELLDRDDEFIHATEDHLHKMSNHLNASITRFSSEIHFYMEKSSQISLEKIDSFTKTQIEAEKWNTELRILIQKIPIKENNITKLPKLELPKFNGNILQFNHFWDRFEASVAKKNISDADKLTYLIGCLEGSALETLQGLETTNTNYTIAVQTIKQRFGQTERVVDAHYEALNNMDKASNNAAECRKTLNNIEHHLRILESLGENIKGNQFRAIILSKFPDKIVYDLKLILPVNDMENIRVGLNKIITAMEHSNKDVLPTTDKASATATSSAVSGATAAALHVGATVSSQPPKKGKQLRKRKFPTPKDHQERTKSKKSKKECIFCRGEHYNSDCTIVQTVDDRKRKLGARCYRCFRMGHRASACTLKKQCYHCRGKHNQALCPKPSKNFLNTSDIMETSVCSLIQNKSFLQTAVVLTSAVRQRNKNKSRSSRVLLDSGSQRSYVTSRLANELGLLSTKEDTLLIYVFGTDKPAEITSPTTEIQILTRRGITRSIKVNVVPKISNRIPTPYCLQNYSVDIIADDGSAGTEIDVLIGNDYYFSFFNSNARNKIDDNLYLVNSDFGWMITGQASGYIDDNNTEVDTLSIVTYCQYEMEPTYYTLPDLPLRDTDMKFLWALESIGITDSPKITREEEAVKQFNETVKYIDQRYYVSWPWITYPPELPTNYGLAYGRLLNMIQRLDNDSKVEYNNILTEQLRAGIIEVMDPQPVKIYQTTPPIHYIPHHLIRQEGKKGRIVYDASAKLKDHRSLNECMYRGPLMLEDLTALLLKFRLNKIGLTADVEKAFLQIGLLQEARDVTRFLWVKDINKGVTEDNILHLRFCRVPFGIVSSPFLLTATIRHHLLKTNDSMLKEIADHCYVDNLVTGTADKESGFNFIEKTRNAFTELSMNLREWTTNDKQLMEKIPIKYRGKSTEEVKVLGLMWDLRNDTLKLKRNNKILDEEISTKNKRGLLRLVASLYDPCGLAAPLVLPAKLLIQELWRRKIKWDDDLPDDLEERWNNATNMLLKAQEIEIPRFVNISPSSNETYELHCFTDASKDSFAAVVYLRILFKNKKTTKTEFIMAKSRIAPMDHKENLKIPRLELLGYVIGKRLLTYVEKTLGLTFTKLYMWTDSKIVLSWMKSDKLLPPFVARRISEIKEKGNIEHRYINTDQNPADIATRPELWESKRAAWFNGPEILQEYSLSAAEPSFFAVVGGLDCEDNEVNPVEIETESMDDNEDIMSTADDSVADSVKELRKLQELHFPDEIADRDTHLKRNLQIFMDMDGLLRCKGRLMNASLPYGTKYPILIPKECEFTDKLIQKVHEQNHHVGAAHTLSIIRQNYWIPQGKSKVQRIIRKCPQCVKHGGGPYKLPPTPALPSERVNYSAPFTYTGIDYFGPMFVNNNKDKRWICLYTCLAVRAVHMEVVKDLTTEECLLAIRRFVAVRGVPELIVSDNALQFKLTAEVLTSSYCVENKIRWKFIPQLSPWHGGFYERLVGLVKNCLKRTLAKQMLNDNQLQTVIKEIEAVVNTRPLTCVGSEIEYVLKPADFLSFSKCITITPSMQDSGPSGSVTKQNLIEGWRKGQLVLNEFKNMFIGQYLTSLRERYQHSHKQSRIQSNKTPSVGDMVQLKGESKNRENWQVGKITSLMPGADGEVRVARVAVGDKIFTRSVGHLYPLEIEEESEKSQSQEVEENPLTLPSASGAGVSEDVREAQAQLTEEPSDTLIGHEENSVLDKQSLPDDTDNPDKVVIENGTENNEEEEITDRTLEREEQVEKGPERRQRLAAIRAREKIAQLTSQLAVLL